MRYFSMFSGIGGFEIGIERAFYHEHAPVGKEPEQEERRQGRVGAIDKPGALLHGRDRATALCVGYSEIDPYAEAIYQFKIGGQNYGDATKINPAELPDFDLLVGGFPCQAFSMAGKRQGFEDTRGTLIFDVLRILKEKQPRHFILENVKGLLSHDSGNTFRTIITSLAELGYAVEWQVLNAKNFGVPQNRERVFIVGHLGGFGGRQVFPIRENNSEDIVLPTITTRITADSNGTYVRKGQTHKEVGGLQIPASGQAPRIRRLTPKECERLMGYPDDWTKYGLYGDEVKEMSDSRRYKACGNGIVTNVVEWVVRRIYEW